VAEQEQGLGIPRRREFVLAMTIFVMLAVIGTAFALWFVYVTVPSPNMPMTAPGS
jgi:hypothetical protein